MSNFGCIYIPAKCDFLVGGVYFVVTALSNIHVASAVVCVIVITGCGLVLIVC